MPRYIGKVFNRYFEFSTGTMAPVSGLMTLDQFEEYYQAEHGKRSIAIDAFSKRIKRADEKGASAMLWNSYEEMVADNRWGEQGASLSVDEFTAKLIAESEKEEPEKYARGKNPSSNNLKPPPLLRHEEKKSVRRQVKLTPTDAKTLNALLEEHGYGSLLGLIEALCDGDVVLVAREGE